MNNEKQEGQAEKLFQQFGKKVDKFLEELNEASGKLNREFEGRFEELKQAADNLKKEASDKDKWKEVESSLKKAGQELENAFRAAFKSKPQDKQA